MLRFILEVNCIEILVQPDVMYLISKVIYAFNGSLLQD